jgi:hypothetical protein
MTRKAVFILFVIAIGLTLVFPGGQPLAGGNSPNRVTPYKLKAGKPINISNTGATSADPEIVAGNGGNAYVVWVEVKSPKELWFNTNETGSWGNKARLDPPFSLGSGEGGRPCLVMDKTGRLHYVFQGKVASGNYEIIYNSGKNRSWAGNENASQTDGGMEWGGSNYPTLDVSPADLYRYAVWMDDSSAPDHWELFMRFKGPEATAWSSLQVLPAYPNCYEPEITIDGTGTAHLIYTRRAYGSAVIWYLSNSTPTNLSTWTTTTMISGQSGIDFPEPTATSDNYGNVYVVWPNMVNGQSDIYLRKKINGSWQAIENVSKTSGGSLYPDVAVDKNTGVVGVVWQEKVGATWQIFFRYFQNGGWSSAQNVSNSSSHCEDPVIAFDETGQVHIAYCGYVNGQYDIFYSGAEGGAMLYPPINLAVESNAASEPHQKVNTLTWEANPDNKGITITNYRIYRKKKGQSDDNYAPIGTVGSTVFSFRDSGLPSNQQFTYNMTSIAEDGAESMGSDPVTDEIVLPPIYPPTGLAVASALGSAPRKKDNTLTWAKNPKNKENEVVKYKIYRKKAEESDEALVFIGSVGPTVFSYRDRNLVNDQKYTYNMTTFSINGNESDPTPSVTDKEVWPPIYPPVNVAVVSVLGDGPYKKDNTLTWAKNPANKPKEVVKYRILRKKQAASPTAYEVIASIGPTVFSFRDKDLVNDQRYTYALLTVSSYGNESIRSGSVTDRAVYAATYPPLHVELSTRLDNSQAKKSNVLTWQDDPQNADLPIKNVRIYRAFDGGGDFALLATVGSGVHRYEDQGLSTTRKYLYQLTSVPAWQIESARTTPVAEAWVFPPISLNLQTQVNDGLFFKEKINTVHWKANPLNNARTVVKYALWRKQLGQDDSAIRVLAELEASVLEYVDRDLKFEDKYIYYLTAMDSAGNESQKSRALPED